MHLLQQHGSSSVDDLMLKIQAMALDSSRAASAQSRDSFSRASEASEGSVTSRMSTSHSNRSFDHRADDDAAAHPAANGAGALTHRRVHIRLGTAAPPPLCASIDSLLTFGQVLQFLRVNCCCPLLRSPPSLRPPPRTAQLQLSQRPSATRRVRFLPHSIFPFSFLRRPPPANSPPPCSRSRANDRPRRPLRAAAVGSCAGGCSARHAAQGQGQPTVS